MIFWMSSTAIGSTPANGSSSRMKRGRVASARAISTRRRSPPDSDSAGASARCGDRQVLEQRVEAVGERIRVEILQLEDGADVLGDRQLAEDRRLLRQVRQPEPRARVDRQPRQVAPVELDPPAVRRRPARRSCRSTSSCRRRWGRAGRRPRRSRRRARRRGRPCVPCSASRAGRPTGGSSGAARRPRRPRSLGGAAARGRRRASACRRAGRRRRCGLAAALPASLDLPGAGERRTWAGTRRARARRVPLGSGGGARASLRLEDLGPGVVRDVVAADLVLAAPQQRAIEELDELLRAVVLDALRIAFVVFVHAVALLPYARPGCRGPSPTASCRRSGGTRSGRRGSRACPG